MMVEAVFRYYEVVGEDKMERERTILVECDEAGMPQGEGVFNGRDGVVYPYVEKGASWYDGEHCVKEYKVGASRILAENIRDREASNLRKHRGANGHAPRLFAAGEILRGEIARPALVMTKLNGDSLEHAGREGELGLIRDAFYATSEGKSMPASASTGQPLTAKAVLSFAREACEALKHVHNIGGSDIDRRAEEAVSRDAHGGNWLFRMKKGGSFDVEWVGILDFSRGPAEEGDSPELGGAPRGSYVVSAPELYGFNPDLPASKDWHTNRNSSALDCWSLGAILFSLRAGAGTWPHVDGSDVWFDLKFLSANMSREDRQELYDKMVLLKHEPVAKEFDKFPSIPGENEKELELLKGVISGFMKTNPTERLTACQALDHIDIFYDRKQKRASVPTKTPPYEEEDESVGETQKNPRGKKGLGASRRGASLAKGGAIPFFLVDDDICSIEITDNGIDTLGDICYLMNVVNKTDAAIYVFFPKEVEVNGAMVEFWGGTAVAPMAKTSTELWIDHEDNPAIKDIFEMRGTLEVWDDATCATLASYVIEVGERVRKKTPSTEPALLGKISKASAGKESSEPRATYDLTPPIAGASFPGDKNNKRRRYGLLLEKAGDRKLACIAVIRSFTNFGLKEAKGLVDSAPTMIVLGEGADDRARALAFRDMLFEVGVPSCLGEMEEGRAVYEVCLKEVGSQKIGVVRTLVEKAVPSLKLKQANVIAGSAPARVYVGPDKSTAMMLKDSLEEVGAVATVATINLKDRSSGNW